MTGEEFVLKNPSFFIGKPVQYPYWEAVNKQAIEHTKRLDKSSLIDDIRPNEPETAKEYRNKNRRLTSLSPINKFKTKTSRIFKSSGLSIDENSLSEQTKAFLDSKPYKYINRRTDIYTFFYECVYGESIDDPNGLIIDFPYNKNNKSVAPNKPVSEGGMPSTQPIDLETIIVPYSKIVHADYYIFAYEGNYVTIRNRSGSERKALYYWVVDNEWWSRYMPVGEDEKGKLKYELERWYRHDVGDADGNKELPINYLPGMLSKTVEGLMYHESLLSGYMHRADEYVSRSSDGQVNWVQHCYPKVVMKEIPCGVCGGNMKVENGKDANGNTIWESCTSCNNGVMTKPHQFGVLIDPQNGGLDEKGGDVYRLITPPESLLKTTFEIPEQILALAKKEIGLDVLEAIAESGRAKDLRLEDLKDILHLIADKLVECMQTHLWYVECYKNVRREDRKRPTVNAPTDFDLKTIADLKEDAENALNSDKLQAAIRYSDRLYKNSPNLKRAKRLMYQWAPSILEEWQVVKDKFLGGIINENEIIKRGNAEWIFMKLSKNPAFNSWDDNRVFEEADKLIEPLLGDGLTSADELKQLIGRNGQANATATT